MILEQTAARWASRAQQLRWFRPTYRQCANRVRYEFFRRGEVLPYRPFWLLLYLTDACNLSCAMCPHHTSLEVDGFPYMKERTYGMSLAMLDHILSRFPEAIVVSLAGVGEPLLHRHFPEVVERLAAANKIIDVTTNGYRLDGTRLDVLTSTALVREISVSLNGADAEEHKRMTGRDGFEKLLENVTDLLDRRRHSGFPRVVSASQVCTRGNTDRWGDYVRLAARLGVDRLYMHNVIDMNVRSDELRILPSNASMRRSIEALPEQVAQTRIIRPVEIGELPGAPRCDWFFQNLAFDAGGSMGSCGRVMNPQAEYGSIEDDEDIWNNAYMRSLRRTFLDDTGSSLADCCRTCVENFE